MAAPKLRVVGYGHMSNAEAKIEMSVEDPSGVVPGVCLMN